MKTLKFPLLKLFIALIPLFYFMAIWNQLPETVPVHYNGNNEADGFGSRYELLGVLGFMALIGFGVSLLVANIQKIDPKRKFQENAGTLNKKISWVALIFISLLSCYIVFQTQMYTSGGDVHISPKVIVIGISALFAILGNYMNNIKQNYFVGIRLPWTLESEDNWRKTHHLASKLWFFGGIGIIAIVLLIPGEYAHYVMLSVIAPITVIPMIYSYRIYKNSK